MRRFLNECLPMVCIVGTLGMADAVSAADFKDTVTFHEDLKQTWGHMTRYALRDRLASDAERAKFQDQITLDRAEADIGMLEFTVNRGGAYRISVHLVDMSFYPTVTGEGSRMTVLVQRTSAVIRAVGRVPSTAKQRVEALIEYVRAASAVH